MKNPVIVIGGGYAGRVAATRLARCGTAVTLVDPSPVLWEKVRLHHNAARGEPRPRSLEAALASVGAGFVHGRARRIREGAVELHDGRCLNASHIALTLGVHTRRDLPGAEHTLTLDRPEDARELHHRVRLHHHILIIGSGFTAIELAGALAAHTRVTLVGSGLGASAATRQATEALVAQGVRCVVGRVLRASPAGAHLSTEVLPADTLVRCTGTQAPSLARDSGLPVDGSGRAIARRDLSITPWCSGAGDGVVIPEMPWVGTGCAVALPMGAHLSHTVQARLRGEPPPDFHFGWGGRILEAGSTAVAQRTRRDGVEVHATTHRAWWWTKQIILRYTSWAPEVERRLGLRAIGALGDPPMPLLPRTAT